MLMIEKILRKLINKLDKWKAFIERLKAKGRTIKRAAKFFKARYRLFIVFIKFKKIKLEQANIYIEEKEKISLIEDILITNSAHKAKEEFRHYEELIKNNKNPVKEYLEEVREDLSLLEAQLIVLQTNGPKYKEQSKEWAEEVQEHKDKIEERKVLITGLERLVEAVEKFRIIKKEDAERNASVEITQELMQQQFIQEEKEDVKLVKQLKQEKEEREKYWKGKLENERDKHEVEVKKLKEELREVKKERTAYKQRAEKAEGRLLRRDISVVKAEKVS